MKITTFARYEWNGEKYVQADERSYEHNGPLALCMGMGANTDADPSNDATDGWGLDSWESSWGYEDEAQMQADPFGFGLAPKGDPDQFGGGFPVGSLTDLGQAGGYGGVVDKFNAALAKIQQGRKVNGWTVAKNVFRDIMGGPITGAFGIGETISGWADMTAKEREAAYAEMEKQGFSKEMVDASFAAARNNNGQPTGNDPLSTAGSGGGGAQAELAQLGAYLPKGTKADIERLVSEGKMNEVVARYYVEPFTFAGGKPNPNALAYAFALNAQNGGALPTDPNWGHWTDEALKSLGTDRTALNVSSYLPAGTTTTTGTPVTGAPVGTATAPGTTVAAGSGGLTPWIAGGTEAQNKLAGLVMAGPGNYTKSPGYDFRMKEGQNALLRKQAAAGRLDSGETDKWSIQYGQDFATQDYDNFLNRYYQSLDPFFKMSGVGQNSAVAEGNWLRNLVAQNAQLDYNRSKDSDAYSQQQSQNWLDILGVWASGGLRNLFDGGSKPESQYQSSYNSTLPDVPKVNSWENWLL